MSRTRIFKDKFLKKNILIGSIVLIIILFGSTYYIDNKLKEYQREEIKRYANIIGSIIDSGELNLEEKDKFVELVLDRNLNNDKVFIGLEELGKYGYFEDVDINNKWIGTSFTAVRATMIGVSIIFIIITVILVIWILYSYTVKVNKVSEALQDLSQGKDFLKLDDKKEGMVSVLYHRYNMTASRMKKWIDDLETEKRLTKELLNDLSHQLKTPIASIKMNTDLILEGYTDDLETERFLENNRENIERMQWITEGLLQLSTLEAECITLNKRESNLKNTLLNAINSSYGKAMTKNINITTLEIEDAIVNHDSKWTSEAIINIIDNSIKYSLPKSEIEISLKDTEWKGEVIVKDYGCGIKKEEKDKIFKRFYRSFDELVQEQEGSGIGLYLSKKIIEDQNGAIKVESIVKEGSTFKIVFYKHILD